MTRLFYPPIIAHRGASAYAPENTMAAFKKAKQLGIFWIEFDVMLSSCGEVIIIHDDTLERTTNGLGLVQDYPYNLLSKLDAGSWFDPAFRGERIPILKQVLEWLKNENMAANIELKDCPGQEEGLVKAVVEVISLYPMNNLLFSSFSLPTLYWLRQYLPTCALAYLMHEWQPDFRVAYQELNCTSLNINYHLLDQKRAQTLKAEQKTLLCYTVNDPQIATTLLSWGVDALFSDNPDTVLPPK